MRDDDSQLIGFLSPVLARWRINKILKYIQGNRILDFGCDTGILATNIIDKDYIGIDISEDIISQAKEIYQQKKNIQFYTVAEFDMHKQTFDTIILAAVLEHVNNPIQLLSDLRKCLNQGGRIIITTPSPCSNRILLLGSGIGLFSKVAIKEHKHLFDKEELFSIASCLKMKLEFYERFEFGLNQLVIYGNE